MSRHSAFQERGISLVELLLGLAITALVLAPLVPLLETASAASRMARNQIALEQEADFALARIAARIRVTASSEDLSKPSTEWLKPAVYSVVGGVLREQQGADTYPLAESVTAFNLSASAAGGAPRITATLSLERDGASTTAVTTVRLGTAL
jgi:Tfp pilus assembly protein PilW